MVPCTTTIFRIEYTRRKSYENRIVTNGTSRVEAVINIFYCVSFLLYPTCTYRHITPLFFTQQLYNREQKLNSTANEQYTIINIYKYGPISLVFLRSIYLFIYLFFFFHVSIVLFDIFISSSHFKIVGNLTMADHRKNCAKKIVLPKIP